MSFRRLLNLVSTDGHKCAYTLRRINMSRFFLPTENKGFRGRGWLLGRDAPPPPMKDSSLPDPIMNFYCPGRPNHFGTMDFMFVDAKVVATDDTGSALMYDTHRDAVRPLPSHTKLKPLAVSITIGNDLYLMDRATNGSDRRFEALAYTAPRPSQEANWHWRSLPPPPPPPCLEDGDDDCTYIDSCAAVAGSSQIWFTARGRDGVDSCTFSFDTEKLVWNKPAADWVLPFSGSAVYIPELCNLWFGISSKDHGHVLCASDLAAASFSQESQPPVLHQVMDDMAGQNNEWLLISAQSVYLGSGKFCIARFYKHRKPQICHKSQLRYHVDEHFFVLAGVEVVIGDGGKLRFVKHNSERYMQLECNLDFGFVKEHFLVFNPI